MKSKHRGVEGDEYVPDVDDSRSLGVIFACLDFLGGF